MLLGRQAPDLRREAEGGTTRTLRKSGPICGNRDLASYPISRENKENGIVTNSHKLRYRSTGEAGVCTGIFRRILNVRVEGSALPVLQANVKVPEGAAWEGAYQGLKRVSKGGLKRGGMQTGLAVTEVPARNLRQGSGKTQGPSR